MSDVSPPDRPSDHTAPPPPPPTPHPGGASTPPPPPPPGLTPPPGYVGYQGAPTPTGEVKRVGGLATAGIVIVPIVALATLLQAVFSAGAVSDADSFLAGELTDDEFQDSIVVLGSVGALASVATVAAGIVTVIWMFRMAKNIRAVGRSTTWSPLFAIFGWFLPPLVLYVIPFLMLREIWKASEPGASDGSDGWRKTRDNPLLVVWFVAFGLLPAVLFVAEVSSLATSGLAGGALETQAEALQDFGLVQWFGAILSVVAAAVWVPFVRQLTRRHTELTGER